MVIKKLLKTGACFAAMALIVGMYISPSIARASYDKGYGYGFDYDGQTKYTNEEKKETYSSVGMECTDSEDEYAYYVARVLVLMVMMTLIILTGMSIPFMKVLHTRC